MAYDRSSNLTDAIDEEGLHVSRTYDALNRLTGITVLPPSSGPVSAEQWTQFSHDGADMLVGHANEFISVSMVRDSLGRCYQEVSTLGPPLNGPASPLTLARQFDPVSNRIALDYPFRSAITLRLRTG